MGERRRGASAGGLQVANTISARQRRGVMARATGGLKVVSQRGATYSVAARGRASSTGPLTTESVDRGDALLAALGDGGGSLA